MKISVALNKKSIKNAIQALEKAKKQLEREMLDDFYKRCYEYFVGQANFHLLSSGVGDLVIAEIQSSWNYERTLNGAKFTNNAEKAVYVEFGVGVVGQENQHTNANNLGNNYQYNMPSESKYDGKYHDKNTWRFYANDKRAVDLVDGFYEEWSTKNGDIKVITKGSPAIMYAFNALEDLRLYMPKIWEEIKIKYWG